MKKILFICFILFTSPAYTHAAIIINEIAWMGNSISANDEWIELYNTGSESISVDGWTLRDGMNLEITLSGAVGAGQYAVLERSNDASAPGTAFLIYTGALSNSGATLSLYRADGSLEDRVVGGDVWQNIGGDNVTKETAQYTSIGWITAGATPGMQNASGSSVEQDTDSIQDTTDTSTDNSENFDTANVSSGSSNTTTLYTTPRELTLLIQAPDYVYVNQSVPMEIVSSGLAKSILQSAQYQWNLGDVSTASGQEITARYAYPGEYVITVTGGYKKYQANARTTITVLPVNFSMTLSTQGEVQVHNDARYEIDISAYRLVSDNVFVFPEGTIILPNATITIPKDRLRYRAQVVLLDAVGAEVSRFTSEAIIESVDTQRTIRTVSARDNRATNKDTSIDTDSNILFTFNAQQAVDSGQDTQQLTVSTIAPQEVTVSSSAIVGKLDDSDAYPNPIQNPKLPYFLLLGVIGIGIFGVFIGRAR